MIPKTDKKQNEKAFPSQEYTRCGDTEVSKPLEYGMDLRDWFAGQALNGLMSNTAFTQMKSNPESVSDFSYQIADAMMKVRGSNE